MLCCSGNGCSELAETMHYCIGILTRRDLLTEEQRLRLELYETKLALDTAYSILQNVTEPELIDSAIYELNSVQMRYNFLHRKFIEISA